MSFYPKAGASQAGDVATPMFKAEQVEEEPAACATAKAKAKTKAKACGKKRSRTEQIHALLQDPVVAEGAGGGETPTAGAGDRAVFIVYILALSKDIVRKMLFTSRHFSKDIVSKDIVYQGSVL